MMIYFILLLNEVEKSWLSFNKINKYFHNLEVRSFQDHSISLAFNDINFFLVLDKILLPRHAADTKLINATDLSNSHRISMFLLSSLVTDAPRIEGVNREGGWEIIRVFNP